MEIVGPMSGSESWSNSILFVHNSSSMIDEGTMHPQSVSRIEADSQRNRNSPTTFSEFYKTLEKGGDSE
jgi:hypothetical protein